MQDQNFCDVHDLTIVGGDKTPRDVAYCNICDAWMCEDCRKDKPRRTAAWAIRASRRLKKSAETKRDLIAFAVGITIGGLLLLIALWLSSTFGV